jgi:hypothetical protein
VEANVVEDEWGDGLKIETSRAGVVRGNTARRNGWGWNPWLFGANVLVQNSSGVLVEGNTVEATLANTEGIVIMHQNRGAAYEALGNTVRGNTVTHWDATGLTGVVTDVATPPPGLWTSNRFAENRYRVLPGARHWLWGGKRLAWADWQAVESAGAWVEWWR